MSLQYVNFGPLAAEIGLLVWGTPVNFNRFRFFVALLHGTLVVGISQTAALNRGRHLYSAGWPSRWALAHILVRLCKTNKSLLTAIKIWHYGRSSPHHGLGLNLMFRVPWAFGTVMF